MSDKAKGSIRLFKVAKELNIKLETLGQHLVSKGFQLGKIDVNAKITDDMYMELLDAFAKEKAAAERHKRWQQAEEERRKRRTSDDEDDEEEDEEDVELATIKPQPEPESVPVLVPEEVEEPEPAPIVEVEEIPLPPALEEVVEEVAVAPVEPEPIPAPIEAPEEVLPVEEVLPILPEIPVISEPEAEGPSVDVYEEEEPELEADEPFVEEEETEEVLDPEEDEEEVEVEAEEPEVEEEVVEDKLITADRYVLEGPKVVGKVDLASLRDAEPGAKRKKRKRKAKRDEEKVVKVDPKKLEETIREQPAATATAKKTNTPAPANTNTAANKNNKKKKKLPVVSEEDVAQAILETKQDMQRQGSKERQGARLRRRERRAERAEMRELELQQQEADAKILRVVEFISANELANLMDVPVIEIIQTCLELGLMVSINQRLDADTITLIAENFDFEVEFSKEVASDEISEQEDAEEDLEPRAPVVTIMGHVDHGKTSLLDYIRNSNVVKGEAGGITQHIGAYAVTLADGHQITFLDTPGHEAFTAMRARGAQVTDIVILVVAADDAVMPQTIEAINHANAAGVPIIVAVNKIDKDGANPDRVLQELASQNVLVEQWGGNVQCSFISAKKGQNIEELLEKVIVEAEILELKANPGRNAVGTIIESRIDKGRGIVATVLVQKGTLSVGDTFVSGAFHGKVRAMFNELDQRVKKVGPSQPALIVGFNGAPDVGDKFIVMDDEREAKEIANKRQQIMREQSMRQKKHITLDEIGRRLALGEFKELNLIIKADVGGSVQALTDSLLKLSTPEVQVRIIHNGVGAITESDINLAAASDAVILGFQVRPASPQVRKLLENLQVDFRHYSVIYDAIEDVRDALEGLLSPEMSEKVLGVAQVRETFRIPKVGTVAGCLISEGKISRRDIVRVVRDGVVIHTGRLSSLRRFKDPVNEVSSGYECGMGVENYNDVNVGDQIEAFEVVQTKRRLSSR